MVVVWEPSRYPRTASKAFASDFVTCSHEGPGDRTAQAPKVFPLAGGASFDVCRWLCATVVGWNSTYPDRPIFAFVRITSGSILQRIATFRIGYSPKSFVYILISLGPSIPALPTVPQAPSVKRGCRAPLMPSKGKQRFGAVSCTERSIELQSAASHELAGMRRSAPSFRTPHRRFVICEA